MPDRTTTTVPEDQDPAWARKEKGFRVVSISLVSLVVALALFGLLGVRTTTGSASSGGFNLSVTHALISRPGLATPLSIVVRSETGPLPGSVTVRIDTPYLAMLDENGLRPEPSSVAANSRWTWWSFDVPAEATELQVDFDARLEPGVQWRRDGSVALVLDDQVTVETAVTTWITP